MMTSFDNNEDKVCSLLKDDVSGSRIRSYAQSHDPRFRDHGVTFLYKKDKNIYKKVKKFYKFNN